MISTFFERKHSWAWRRRWREITVGVVIVRASVDHIWTSSRIHRREQRVHIVRSVCLRIRPSNLSVVLSTVDVRNITIRIRRRICANRLTLVARVPQYPVWWQRNQTKLFSISTNSCITITIRIRFTQRHGVGTGAFCVFTTLTLRQFYLHLTPRQASPCSLSPSLSLSLAMLAQALAVAVVVALALLPLAWLRPRCSTSNSWLLHTTTLQLVLVNVTVAR